jgi:phosphohistidine phosphatase SixA
VAARARTDPEATVRYLELRRHTDNSGDALTEDGVAAAQQIGRERLHPPYAMFVSTGAARATQMAEILRDAAGQDDVPVVEVPGLRSSVEDRWREAARAAGKGADVQAMRAVDPDLVDSESRHLGDALRRVVGGLPEGGRALVVGHSPTNEAAVLGLNGSVLAPLGKGAGVLVTESGGTYTVEPLD